MATAVSLNINIPKGDIRFVHQMAKRMGWSVSEVTSHDKLYDAETGTFLNEETMQAVRDIEAGKVKSCKDVDELIALV